MGFMYLSNESREYRDCQTAEKLSETVKKNENTEKFVSNLKTQGKKNLKKKNPNETEINNLAEKEFKALVIGTLIEHRKR